MPAYHICTYKEYEGYVWCNGYRVNAGSLSVARDASVACTDFERLFHSSVVNFPRVRVSADPDPSHQDFVSYPTSLVGLAARPVANLLPPTVCLHIGWHGAAGRPGKSFYRYALGDTDIQGTGDSGIITNTTYRADLDDMIDDFLAALAALAVELVIGELRRLVTGGGVVGIASNNTHHGWYNRGAPGAP